MLKMYQVVIVISLIAVGLCGCRSSSSNANSTSAPSAGSNSDSSNTTNLDPATLPSTTSKPGSTGVDVKDTAQQIAGGGDYRARDVTTDGTQKAGVCACTAQVSLRIQPVGKSNTPVQLCVSTDHSVLNDYAEIQSGNLVRFKFSESQLDKECADNPASYLMVDSSK